MHAPAAERAGDAIRCIGIGEGGGCSRSIDLRIERTAARDRIKMASVSWLPRLDSMSTDPSHHAPLRCAGLPAWSCSAGCPAAPPNWPCSARSPSCRQPRRRRPTDGARRARLLEAVWGDLPELERAVEQKRQSARRPWRRVLPLPVLVSGGGRVWRRGRHAARACQPFGGTTIVSVLGTGPPVQEAARQAAVQLLDELEATLRVQGNQGGAATHRTH